jgi:hypothetical protein
VAFCAQDIADTEYLGIRSRLAEKFSTPITILAKILIPINETLTIFFMIRWLSQPTVNNQIPIISTTNPLT